MKTVLLSQEIHKDAIKLMKKKGYKVVISSSPDDEMVRKYITDASAIIVRTATKLSRETIFSAKKLEVIARTGSGVDNIDVEAASEKNIPVCNTPAANIESVAEHTVAIILALSKYLFKMDSAIRENKWEIRNEYLPFDLQGKILGILGLGKIGSLVAEKCYNCFNMKVMFFDPFISKTANKNVKYKRINTIEDLFSLSDFISIHIPYTEKNHHIINKDILEKMKRDAFLINTSRGGIIDEEALAKILSRGRIAGAVLDVFEKEPPSIDNPLIKLNNIILSPHSAALTKESSKKMAIHAVESVIDILEGRKPRWIFNLENIKLNLN
jgi:D-3-phosphoglycerate dehydrogenase